MKKIDGGVRRKNLRTPPCALRAIRIGLSGSCVVVRTVRAVGRCTAPPPGQILDFYVRTRAVRQILSVAGEVHDHVAVYVSTVVDYERTQGGVDFFKKLSSDGDRTRAGRVPFLTLLVGAPKMDGVAAIQKCSSS
jgi:hypothetical protein